MFLSSDLFATRKTKNIDNRDLNYSEKQTETQNFNHQNDKEKLQQDSLAKKVEKFISVNKRHQFDEVCVCQDCIYVKQLQRYESLKMDLSKNSSYRAQYNKNNYKRNLSKGQNLADSSFSLKPQESNISKNPYVHLGSVYRNQYASRSLQKVQKPHPADLLKFTGPSSALSSYKQMYSNLNGSFLYVQPLKQDHMPQPVRKFKAQSLYANDFKVTKTVETQSGKIKDQLKLGKPSMVKQTTHQSQYSNPENYNLKSQRYTSSTNKKAEEPNFSFQYSNFQSIQKQSIEMNMKSHPLKRTAEPKDFRFCMDSY